MTGQPEKQPLTSKPANIRARRVRTPTVIQMEAVECGAAALGIILSYHGRYLPLEELRVACGVSRDGSKAHNVIKAAQKYGLIGKGFRDNPENLGTYALPFIVFWNFNHFLVVEGFSKSKVYLNDPAEGPRAISWEEFDRAFTGVVLTFERDKSFKAGGAKRSLVQSLRPRVIGLESAIFFIVLAGLLLMLTGLVIPAFSRVFIDQILIRGQDWLPVLLLGMVMTAVMRTVVTALQQYFLLRFESRLAISTSSQFFWHVLHLPIEFFTQRYAGDIGGRVGINDRLAQLLSRELATALLNMVLIIFYVLLMITYDFLLTLIGVTIAALNIVALRYIQRRRVDASQKMLQERGKLTGKTMSGLMLMETIKATGSEIDFFSQWSGLYAKSFNAEQQVTKLATYLNSVPILLTAFSSAAILAIGGLRVIDGALTIGMLVAFQSLMSSFIGPFNEVVNLGGTLQEVTGDLNRLDDVLRYPTDPLIARELAGNEPAFEPTPGGTPRLSGQLALNNLTFGYSRLEKPLVEGLNLNLKPGQRVALVGGSGSGKSTVAKLVAGLYEPWDGEILFDGKTRAGYRRRILNDSVAMVDQDISLFAGSIRENLTLWDSSVSEVDIIRAAKDAAIHDDIAVRIGSYDAQVEEGGRNFSGGQRQRLEIARALVNNPTILVLDEATSALDPLTEQHIDDSLRRRGCTCLIIAHRLSTIRDADEIIVLERGKVVQRGTHERMIKMDGPYARLLRSEEYQSNKSVLQNLLESL
jgi:NHLM bacteriocin system ABC transporter peptidase/ATP-binding protein